MSTGWHFLTPTYTPTSTPTPELPLGLEGYWALEETSGGRLDSSGWDNHLTDHNTVESVVGQLGLAADLESDRREYLSIGDAAQSGLDIDGSLTLAGWINAERVERYEYGVSNRGYRLDLRPGNGIGFIVSPDGAFASGYLLEAHPTFTLSPGTWYRVAEVFDAGARTLSVYLDGELVATRSVTYDRVYNSSAPFMLGADMQSGSVVQHFDGGLDEWRVYSRALSESEVEALIAPSR